MIGGAPCTPPGGLHSLSLRSGRAFIGGGPCTPPQSLRYVVTVPKRGRPSLGEGGCTLLAHLDHLSDVIRVIYESLLIHASICASNADGMERNSSPIR